LNYNVFVFDLPPFMACFIFHAKLCEWRIVHNSRQCLGIFKSCDGVHFYDVLNVMFIIGIAVTSV